MSKSVYKYDHQGRPRLYFWAVGKIVYTYKYVGLNIMKETILCPKNPSNYKTIVKYIKQEGTWKQISRLEIGDVYRTYYLFEDNLLVLIIRINSKTKSKFKKQIVTHENGARFWTTEYNNKKNIGFKIDINKLIK